jgi:capsular exopolysaccharide synthesis family protein
MVQRKARMDSIREELQKAVDSAESEYNAARQKEFRFKSELDQQKENVVRTDSNAIRYNMLRDEVSNIRKLINTLDERRTEAQVSAKLRGLEASNISIIDYGEVPNSPFSPKTKLNLLLALIIGLGGGVGIAFLLEQLDNTVKGPEDVEKLAGLPSLGIIPRLVDEEQGKKKKRRRIDYGYLREEDRREKEAVPRVEQKIELINHLHPKLIIAEDYRTVRTSILLSHADKPPKSIVFSSALPKEGKSVTVANMAVAFSQLGERVLVVDSDLRKPRLHKIFEAKNGLGLSNYLTGKIPLKDAIQKTSIENIYLIPSGPIPPNPSELLNSKKMKLLLEDKENGFNYIFFDTPPVLAVIDAVILSSITDSTVFIIKAGKTMRKPFLNAVAELTKVGAKILGVVFNELEVKRGDFYFMDYYRYYKYDYYADSENKPSQNL